VLGNEKRGSQGVAIMISVIWDDKPCIL